MYTTAALIRNEMAQLPDRVTDEYINVVINKAQVYIDTALAPTYMMPILDELQVPNMIKMMTLDLAVFFLYERLYSSNAPNLDEYQKVRYDRVMELIDKLNSGELTLPGIEANPNEGTNGFGSTTQGLVNIFDYDLPEW